MNRRYKIRCRRKQFKSDNKINLIKIPCQVGDYIWAIDSCSDSNFDLYHCQVTKLEYDGSHIWIQAECWDEDISFDFEDDEIGVYWFFDKNLAAKKLIELNEKI